MLRVRSYSKNLSFLKHQKQMIQTKRVIDRLVGLGGATYATKSSIDLQKTEHNGASAETSQGHRK